MTALGATLLVIALAWTLLVGGVSGLASWSWGAIQSRLDRIEPPAARARAAFLIAMAPAVVATLVVAAALWPGLLDALGGNADHCIAHADHPHLCLRHPSIALTPGLAVLALVTAGLALARSAPALRRDVRALGAGARLRRLPSTPLAGGVRCISTPRPLCFTSGLLHPSIRVSEGLWRALDPRERTVVLAHERAHVRRRDPLVQALAALGSLFFTTRARRRLLETLQRASERACDEAAARAVDDRIRVAETLLAVERLMRGDEDPKPGHLAPGFGDSALEERVSGLLAPTPEPSAPRLLRTRRGRPVRARSAEMRSPLALLAHGLAPAVVAALLLSHLLHHALEHLLASLVALG